MIERLISIVLRHPDYLRSHAALGELTSAGATYPHTLRDVAHDAREGRGQAIAMVGILLLIATPIVRVAMSTALFAVEKDKLYAGITLVVLILLLVSLLTGLT